MLKEIISMNHILRFNYPFNFKRNLFTSGKFASNFDFQPRNLSLSLHAQWKIRHYVNFFLISSFGCSIARFIVIILEKAKFSSRTPSFDLKLNGKWCMHVVVNSLIKLKVNSSHWYKYRK